MSMFDQKNCCGFNTDYHRVTLLGLLTFAYPALIASLVSVPLLMPFGWKAGRGLSARAAAASRAIFDLINASLLVEFRCRASGSLFALSPRGAGLFYRYVNITLLTSVWAAMLAAGWSVR